jgi:hypothetical protein
MARAKRHTVVLVFLVVLSPRCFAQAEKPGTSGKTQAAPPTTPFEGCYELKFGRWWPWSFGEDTQFVTPPSEIRLLPVPGTEGFEKNGFLIRRISPSEGSTSGRRWFSYWKVKSADRVELTWTNGFSGVFLRLEGQGDKLRGWAHPHFDFPTPPPRIMHVTAQRIACDAHQ